MTEDELLKRIIEDARARRHVHRWDALAAGQLPDEELADLEMQARWAPDLATALEAYRPLESGARASIVDRLHAQVTHPGPVRVRRAPRWRRGWLLAPACAAAAAVLVVVLWRAAPGDLPPYSLTVRGGVERVRGATEAASVPRFLPGSTLDITLRPKSAVRGQVAVRVYVEQGGAVRTLAIPAQISATGAVRLRARVGESLRLPAGVHTLIVAVGRPGTLPDGGRILHLLKKRPATRHGGFSLLTTRVNLP